MHGRANVSSDSAHIGHLDGHISNVASTSPGEVDPTVARYLGSQIDGIRDADDTHPHFIQYGNSSFDLEDVHLNAELNKCSSPLKGNGCDSASPAISCSFPSQIPTPAYSDMFDRSHILSHKENRSQLLHSSESSNHLHSSSSVGSPLHRVGSHSTARRPRSVSCTIVCGREQLYSVPSRESPSSPLPIASLIPRLDYSDTLFSSSFSSQDIVFNDLTLQ